MLLNKQCKEAGVGGGGVGGGLGNKNFLPST